jgi:hypothetical protein
MYNKNTEVITMQVLFLVLHKVECLHDVLLALQKEKISGGTIIESTGMINTLKSYDNFLLDSLRVFLENPREESRVLFFVLKDEEIDKAKKCIDKAVGGINNPDTGIMFGINVSFVEGLKKES